MLRDGLYAAYTWRVRHFRGRRNKRDARSGSRPTAGRTDSSRRLEGGRAGRRARGRRGTDDRAEAEARARWGVDFGPFVPGRAGTGAAPGRPRRSHLHLRATIADAWRRALPPAARGLRRPADRSHALRQDPRSVHPPLRAACGRPTKRSASARVVGMVLLYVVGGIGVGLFFMLRSAACCGARRRSGASSSALLQALATPQRVAAAVDDLRHRGPAHDVHRRSRLPTLGATVVGLLGVLGAVVHGRRNADAPRVRPAPAVLARLGEGTWQLDRHPRPHRRGLSARVACSSPTTSCST